MAPAVLTTIVHPLAETGCDERLTGSEGMAAFARAVDEGGYDAIAFADHPAPSAGWMDAGGHGSLDPFAALAHVAALTHRVRLMTYLVVLPYRNPFLTLKSAATVDRLSGGRLTMTVGTGYLRSEFTTLTAPFESRNADFDAALELLRAAWGADRHVQQEPEGRDRVVALEPLPVQAHLPILIGGNSLASRRRAVASGEGWSPLIYPEAWSTGNRTAAITTVAELAHAVAAMRADAESAGRGGSSVHVQVDAPSEPALRMDAPVEEHLDYVGRLREAGADAVVLRPEGTRLEVAVETVQAYAAGVRPLL